MTENIVETWRRGEALSNKYIVGLLALVSCALWGSAVPAVKVGYSLLNITVSDYGNQLIFAGYRFVLAGLIVIAISSFRTGELIYPKVRSLSPVLKISMFQTVLQYLFYYIGIAHASGVSASIVQGSTVFAALILSSLVFRQETFTLRKATGCVIGFFGVFLASIGKTPGTEGLSFVGEGLIFFAAVAYGVSSSLMKRYSQDHDPVMISGYQFLFGGIILALCGIAGGGSLVIANFKAMGVLFYMAFASAAAYTIWALLLGKNKVSSVAIYGFSNPIFGVLFSCIFLPMEKSLIGINTLFALLFVCFGIFTVNFSRGSEEKG